MIIHKACPKCSCPYWREMSQRTADNYGAWQDSDGKWYCGPAREDIDRRCSHCGWGQRIVKKRGKVESVESDNLE